MEVPIRGEEEWQQHQNTTTTTSHNGSTTTSKGATIVAVKSRATAPHSGSSNKRKDRGTQAGEVIGVSRT